MLIALVAAAFASSHAPPRIERLVALARLDAAVHYFHPAVATRPSAWDSVFAASVVRIADAPGRAEYGRLVRALLRDGVSASPPDDGASSSSRRALVYEGFPTALMQSSGGYGIRWRPAEPADSHVVDMGEGVRLAIPLSEAGDTAGAIRPFAPPASEGWRTGYPSAGYRLLAAARVWSTIRLFFPYKALIGESWDAAFRAALPEFEQARDAREYGQAIARLSARVHDTHVSVTSAPLSTWLGAVPVGASARIVEGQLVITRIVDSSATRAGLQVGDVVTEIDGEPVAQRIARLTPFLAASTPQSLRFRLARLLLSGPDGRMARLEVRGADGAERVLAVPRSIAYSQALRAQRAGNIIRVLPGNIGYVDLDRLPLAMVDSAFRVLASTSAMVLDVRGYPNGTAWAIAPRLNTHPEPTGAAAFRRLIVPSPDTSRTSTFEFTQTIPPWRGEAKYAGRTVMLIDERTISQAEHTGLFFEAANGTTFIGSPSTGANGDVTVLPLPGSVAVSFTGHDVRHVDGRQLQRVGLTPQVTVSPTIAGIRAGRDEVLEAAHRFLGGSGVIPPDTTLVAPLPNATAAGPVAELAPEPPAAGWMPMGSAPAAYRMGIDTTVAHSGRASGHITARGPSPRGFATMAQPLNAVPYRGKRVRFSAWVRSRGVADAAAMWLRVDGQGGMLAFDNMLNRPIGGTTDWRSYSIVLDVPADADGIVLGFLLRGGGEAWIDDAVLEAVGTEVASTNMAPPAPDPSRVEEVRREYLTRASALTNPGFEPR